MGYFPAESVMLPPLKLKKCWGWESGQEYFLRKGEAPKRLKVKSVEGALVEQEFMWIWKCWYLVCAQQQSLGWLCSMPNDASKWPFGTISEHFGSTHAKTIKHLQHSRKWLTFRRIGEVFSTWFSASISPLPLNSSPSSQVSREDGPLRGTVVSMGSAPGTLAIQWQDESEAEVSAFEATQWEGILRVIGKHSIVM